MSKKLIDNYNKTVSILTSNQEKLDRSLTVFERFFEETISNLNNYFGFQDILSQINLDCQNLIAFINNLEEAITFAKLNTLHISSSDLLEMLGHIKTI